VSAEKAGRRASPQFRIVHDWEAANTVDLAALGSASLTPGSALRAVLEPGRAHEPSDLPPPERIGGLVRPAWHPERGRGEVSVVRAADAWHLPRYGAVIDAHGHGFRSTLGGRVAGVPDLSRLPGVVRVDDELRFSRPFSGGRHGPATVFTAWGGGFNYGHYLLDCLPALLAVEEAGLLAHAPPIAPPLSRWRRDLLALAFPGLAVEQTRADVLRLAEAVFASPMDHFLHEPNLILTRLRERLLASGPLAREGSPRRLYVSRRTLAYPMRVLADEARLEAALRKRGFAIMHPERMAVADQIAVFRDAEVVVGPTGAGLANALFCRPGARIVELQPETFTSGWVQALCTLTGAEWSGWFCPAPVAPARVSPVRRLRPGFRFVYEAPVSDLLDWLDARL